MDPITAWAAAAGLSWTSGIRLYGVLFLCGAAHALGWIELPTQLRVLANPAVLGVSGCLLAVEFITDKIPLVDSLWDGVHTFIRLPAGALLAAGVFGPHDAPAAIAAGLLGGTLATGSHLTKAGGRALLNTSPEPFSNWTASVAEAILVPITLLLTFKYPLILLGVVLMSTALTIWLAPKLVRALYSICIHVVRRDHQRRKDPRKHQP